MKILRKETAPRYERDRITSYLLVSERTCESRNLTTTLVEMQPHGVQRVHSHEPEQMYYILEGEGIMTVGNETKNVSAGDCIFLPAGVPHGLENKANTALRYLSAASPSFTKQQADTLWPLRGSADE